MVWTFAGILVEKSSPGKMVYRPPAAVPVLCCPVEHGFFSAVGAVFFSQECKHAINFQERILCRTASASPRNPYGEQMKTSSGVLADIQRFLRRNLSQVFIIHLVYVALGFLVFTPLVGLTGRLALQLSGSGAMADFDILFFLLTPVGMISLIVLAALLITILVIEQSSLMAIAAAELHSSHISCVEALRFSGLHMPRIFSFAVRLVLRILLITIPFLGLCALVAGQLITDHDINFYLSTRPPVFTATAVIIALLLAGMVFVLLRGLLSWSLALQLVLFENTPPAAAFAESRQLTRGHHSQILATFALWALAAFLLGLVITGAIQLVGSWIVPSFFNSLKLLVPVLGGLVLLWSLGNLVITTLTSAAFAALLVLLFDRYGPGVRDGEFNTVERATTKGITPRKIILASLGATAIALGVGFLLLHGVRTSDNLTIIAHRGAAGKAPENTLASIRQALEDNTDWVEIDVQETADGTVVVVHDSDFMKLAGVETRVWEATLEQLQKIDIGSWFDPKFSNQRVPTLAEVLALVKDRAGLVIELKYYGHDQNLEQRVVDLVEQAGMADQVAIMSLKYDGVEKLHRLRPDWTTGLLVTKTLGDIEGLDIDFIACNVATASPGFIRRIHDAGKKIYTWTVNDQVTMSRMMSLGVDGIITDEPALARRVLADRADLSSVERLLIHTAILLGRPVPPRIPRDQSP